MACSAYFNKYLMSDPGNHHPEQEDLDRARRIMEGTRSGSSAAPGDDALLYYLGLYKRNAVLRNEDTPSDSTWNQISAKIDAHENSGKSGLLSLAPMARRVAAVFLIAAVLGLAYILFQPAEPDLLASTDAQQSVVELADGSDVTLRPYSRLYEMAKTDTRHTYRIEGEGYFEVAEKPSRLFTVVSGESKVVVTGTKFTVSNWSDAVRVYLESGGVTFSSLDESQMVQLRPGEYSEQTGTVITEPATVDDRRFTGWLRDEIILNSRTVADVSAEIEQHFNVTLQVPDSVANERLSGSLQLQDSEQVLSDLALSLNGRFMKIGEKLYRFEPLP